MAKQEVDFVRKSTFSGKMNTMTLNVDMADYKKWREGGELIQRAMPYLSAGEREFLMTGVTPTEWDELFKPASAPTTPPQGDGHA